MLPYLAAASMHVGGANSSRQVFPRRWNCPLRQRPWSTQAAVAGRRSFIDRCLSVPDNEMRCAQGHRRTSESAGSYGQITQDCKFMGASRRMRSNARNSICEVDHPFKPLQALKICPETHLAARIIPCKDISLQLHETRHGFCRSATQYLARTPWTSPFHPPRTFPRRCKPQRLFFHQNACRAWLPWPWLPVEE